MSICLKIEGYPEFFQNPENAILFNDYIEEVFDGKAYSAEIVDAEMKDKHFFQINKSNTAIGFGAYKDEKIDGKDAFTLHEFYVAKPFRDISQLYEIRRQIIVALKILDKALWTCVVDNDDEKKKRAYQKLGFVPMWDEGGLLLMGMDLEGF